MTATKTNLTRDECAELYIALAATEAGLSPTSTITAADNLNALHPVCAAHDKGKTAFARECRKIEKDVKCGQLKREDADERLEKMGDELNAKGEESVEVALFPLKLSDDDIAGAKIKPRNLAILRRLLPAAK
jgi:hypothetical protein